MLIKCYCVFTTIVLFSHFHDGYCDSGRKADRYLAHIFRKYGSQGTLSFEVSRILIRFGSQWQTDAAILNANALGF